MYNTIIMLLASCPQTALVAPELGWALLGTGGCSDYQSASFAFSLLQEARHSTAAAQLGAPCKREMWHFPSSASRAKQGFRCVAYAEHADLPALWSQGAPLCMLFLGLRDLLWSPHCPSCLHWEETLGTTMLLK